MLGLYVLVFGYIFGGSFDVIPDETPIDYGLGIFVGLVLFHFVAEVLAVSPTTIVANSNFVKKVVFPLEILPVAHVLAAFFHLLTSMVMVLIGIAVIGPGLTWGILWIPVILLPLLLCVVGLSWVIAALAVFFRDISQLSQFLSMALMFASAVFYPASKIPFVIGQILEFNPMLVAIEIMRNAILWNHPVSLTSVYYLFVIGIISVIVGNLFFRRLRPAFADVV